MSAVILSIVSHSGFHHSAVYTVRPEIACRHFLPDVMYIGSSSRCFKEAMTRNPPLRARWTMGSSERGRPSPHLPLSPENPLCLVETYDPARRAALRHGESSASEDADRGHRRGGDRSGGAGLDVPQLARRALRGQVLRRPPASGLRNRLRHLLQRFRLAAASAEVFAVHVRRLLL